ncbi:MAG: DNA polymerase III subunit delta [Gammaproteobacteria bacterium]
MKLSLAQLSHQLQQLAPIYIIASAEPLLAQEAMDMIYRAARQAGFNDRIWMAPAHKDDWERLGSLHDNLDLFSQQQIIHLHIHNGKPSPYGIQQLQRYVQKPNSNQILVINIDKLDKALLSSRWFTQLEQAGILVAIWPLSTHELTAWLQRRAEHYQIQLEKSAFTELQNRTQGNLLATEQALQQLALFPQPIRLAELKALIADQAQYAILDFVQHLLHHQYRECLTILQNLQKNDVEPTWIIWQLAMNIRKAQLPIARALLPLLNEVEIGIKSGDTLNGWTLLRNFIYAGLKNYAKK